MTQIMQRIDQNIEWYKQFWPWFLIFLPGSVVVACIVTITIAVQSADSMVVDDYYKHAMQINRDLSKSEYAKEVNLSGSFLVRANKLELAVSVNKDTIKLAPTLMLEFSHPAKADKDFSITLVQLADRPLTKSDNKIYARYVSQENERIKSLAQAAWYIRLLPLDKDWQLKGKIKNIKKTIFLYAD